MASSYFYQEIGMDGVGTQTYIDGSFTATVFHFEKGWCWTELVFGNKWQGGVSWDSKVWNSAISNFSTRLLPVWGWTKTDQKTLTWLGSIATRLETTLNINYKKNLPSQQRTVVDHADPIQKFSKESRMIWWWVQLMRRVDSILPGN